MSDKIGMIDQYKTLSEQFLRKGFWLYLFSFIIAPIWYIIKIIISNELSVEEVWILYGIISLITLISSFNDFWITDSLNHFIPKYITEKKYDKIKSILCYALLIQLTTWIIIWLFFILWAEYIANNHFKSIEAKNILKIFSLFFLWINLFQIVSTFFISIQNTLYNKIIDFFRMFFTLLLIVYLYLYDKWNIISFSFSWIIWLYLWVIIAFFIFYKKYYLIYLKEVKIIRNKLLFLKIFKYALWILLWAQAATILWQMDMQMIIYILWSKDAWYYTNYLSIIGIPFMLIWPIFWLLFPIFSEMHSKSEQLKIKETKYILQNNFILAWVSLNIFLFIFSEVIAYVLFWGKFINSWIILKYSILLLTFNFLLQINFNIMAWLWKVKERVKIISIVILFNFIMNLILIKAIWVNWAALATWIWWVIIWILSEYYLWKKYYTKFNIKNIVKNIIIFSTMWYILYIYILPIFNFEEWRIKNLINLLIVIVIWIIIFLVTNQKELKKIILQIKRL